MSVERLPKLHSGVVGLGSVTVHRPVGLAGIELLVERDVPRLELYCTDFALMVPIAWRGEVLSRRKRRALAPGRVVCAEPGELLVTSAVRETGLLKVLLIAKELMGAALVRAGSSLAESGPVAGTVRVSKDFRERLTCVISELESSAASAALPARLDSLLDSVVSELFRRGGEQPSARRGHDATERVLDHLRSALLREEDLERAAPDLTTLSKQAGLSRFQTLRLFRRHYGVTPHAYQLHFRIALARRTLLSGQNAAEAAARHGFADQSHLTKHFKRLVGITPGQYARSR
jgi:AraC-like DNA-binding protein